MAFLKLLLQAVNQLLKNLSPQKPKEKDDSMSQIKELKRGSNIQITPHFNSNELDCKCKNADCTITLVDYDHINKLEKLRVMLGKSIRINSAYRCEKHNKSVGGATKSQHREGTATDITVSGMTPDKVAEYCLKIFDGIGQYNSFTHVDSRGTPATWDFRTKS